MNRKFIFKSVKDKILSPYTGWTRLHWEELAEFMISSFQPFLTPGKGGLALPNPVRWMDAFLPEPKKMKSFYWMEGFTRTRLLLACWMMGTGKTTIQINGKETDILSQFIEGLLSASDPKHAEYIGDRYGNNQWIAEISNVAFAVFIARDLVWKNLSGAEKRQITDWLFSSTGRKIPHNNWYLFLANTHLVLKCLGEKYDEEEMQFCLKNIQSFDLENGWFLDGDDSRGFSIEQYNAWGFHYFLPAFVYMNALEKQATDWIIDRLQKFLKCFRYFFGADGSFPMWGRSWIYRQALTVPFIWAEILNVSPLESGESRRIVSGQMAYYLRHSYFHSDGTPAMGYAGENLDIVEPYSQYGSAYWGNAVFLNLLMDKNHPFWMQKEQAVAVEKRSYCIGEKKLGMIVSGNQSTGEVQIINHKVWHQKEGPGTKYAKKYTNFVYSSHFGIDLRRDKNGYNCDSMFSISPDGYKFSQRVTPHLIGIDDNYGVSYHYPLEGFPFVAEEDEKIFSADKKLHVMQNRSVKLTTHTFRKKFCLVRLNIIDTKISLKRIREGGFALNFNETMPEVYSDGSSIGFSDGRRGSFIKSLIGFQAPESAEHLFQKLNNSNTLGGKSITPTIYGDEIEPGRHFYLSYSGTWFGDIRAIHTLLSLIADIRLDKDSLTIAFSDLSRFRIQFQNSEEYK